MSLIIGVSDYNLLNFISNSYILSKDNHRPCVPKPNYLTGLPPKQPYNNPRIVMYDNQEFSKGVGKYLNPNKQIK